jgi:hypothetical protein
MSDSIPSSADESFWEPILEEDITVLPNIEFFAPLPAKDVENRFFTGVWPVCPPPVPGYFFLRSNVEVATVPEGSLSGLIRDIAIVIPFK